MINSNAELSRAIRKRSSEYTTKEIFSSRYLESYISGVITGMCEHLDRHPYLTIEYNPLSDETAYTDGCEVYCNSASPLIRELKTPYKMFVSLFGHCSHETAHYLYTDFNHLNPLRKQWQIGSFDYYPCLPKAEGAQEFKDYLNSHPNYRMLYAQCMATLVNVLEDVFIENMCRAEFAGLATIGLQVVNDEKYRLFPYEEDLFQRVLECQSTPLDVAIGLIQMMKLGYQEKSNGKTTKEQQMVKDFIHSYIDDINDEIETLSWETNGLVRAKLFNEIFVKLQGLLPRPKENQDYQCMPMDSGQEGSEQKDGENKEQSNDSSNSQKPSDKKGSDDKKEDSSESSGKSSDRDFSEEEKEKLSNNSSSISEETGVTKEAKGSTSPAKTGKPDKEKAKAEKEGAKEAASSEKTLEDIFNDAKKKIAEEETLSEDEENHLKELEKEATEINNHSKKVENACFDGFKIYRESYTNAINYKNEYNEIYLEIANEAKSLARKINNILKDDSLIEEYESGYMFGSRLNTKDLYRQDGKAFSRLNNPGETKRIITSLLIDESGSMRSGNKSIKARRAAILMEDALRRINIPLFVVGHTEYNCKVILKPYVDPETNDNRDKYRLSGITAYSGNIDGAAIHYMKEKLLKRPEEVKVLIVISDGLPAGTSYYSRNSQNEDTKLAIKDARRNGIKVFGAVVDEFEDVASLYDANFCFDCSSGRMLEKTLCMLVKKYVLINQ